MVAQSKGPKSLWWFEPRWSFRPRLKRELTGLVQFKLWLRVLAVVILLTVLLAYALKRKMPNLEFDWERNLAASIGLLIASIGCFAGLMWFIPPTIRIDSKGISRQFGQQVYWLLRPEIRRVTIDITDPSRPFLNVETMAKKTLECGFGPKVSPEALATFLRKKFPEETKNLTLQQALEDLNRRDTYDSTREISPLKQAPDAFLVDTSDLTVDEIVFKILEHKDTLKTPFGHP